MDCSRAEMARVLLCAARPNGGLEGELEKPMRVLSFTHTSVIAITALALVACSGGSGTFSDPGSGSQTSGTEPDNSGSKSGTGAAGGGANGTSSSKPAGATDVRCDGAEDCGSWACECEKGAPVESRSCTNGYCLDPDHVCPKACANFGSNWTGGYSGSAEPPKCGGLRGNTAKCDACLRSKCCAEGDACARDKECNALEECSSGCTSEDCVARCEKKHPKGVSLRHAISSCVSTSCKKDCQ